MKILTKKRLIQINDDLFSLIIRERDGYKCKMCKDPKPNKNVECSHIVGRDNKAVRWDLDNAFSLCFYHHRFYWHGGKMTEEDRIKFCEELLGEDYDELKIRARRVVKFNLDFCKSEFVRLMNLTLDTGDFDFSKKVVALVPMYVVKELLLGEIEVKELLEVKDE